MARRSTSITFSNGTPVDLNLVGTAGPCHGSWTHNTTPPQTIASGSTASWGTESSGILTGTEAWVKYETTNINPNCIPELIYIHWDNPFVWGSGTNPIDFSVTTTDVTPPCDSDKGRWDIPGGFPHGGTNPDFCTHELFGISASGGGPQDIVVNWPALLGLTILGQADINLTFAIGCAQKAV
jgi:hypothetical protein